MKKIVANLSLVFAFILLFTSFVSAEPSGQYTLKIHSELLAQAQDGREAVLELVNLDTQEKQELRVGSKTVELKLKEGNYQLKEIEAPKNTSSANQDVKFSVPFLNKDGSVLDSFTIELKYQEELQDILIVKKDKESKKALKGAEFYIYELEGDSVFRILLDEKLISNDKGEVLLKGFQIGKKYRIKEVTAPEGYKILEESKDFTLDKFSDKPIEFVFYNEKEEKPKEEPKEKPKEPEEKPKTNDPESYLIAGGLGLVVLAGAGLYVFKKKSK